MVHASWSGFQRLQAKPSELLAVLRELVGDHHTLVMPTGAIEKYRDGMLLYDIKRSPSRMGLLSETLRRAPEAPRSPVPIAPVSAIGPAADSYTRDYREESNLTPWGRGSPYWEIANRGGQVLVLGIDFVRTLTLMHTALDVLLESNPIPNYYEPIDYLVVRDGIEEHGRYVNSSATSNGIWQPMRLGGWHCASGTLSERNWRGVRICVVDAKAFLDWHLPIARANRVALLGMELACQTGQTSILAPSIRPRENGFVKFERFGTRL